MLSKQPEERSLLDIVQMKIVLNNNLFFKQLFGSQLNEIIIENVFKFRLLAFKENTALPDSCICMIAAAVFRTYTLQPQYQLGSLFYR